MPHIHWVDRGIGTPKDRDEVSRREVCEFPTIILHLVNTFTSSRLSWVLHESWILDNVSGVRAQTFRSWFHVPLMMVHPILAQCVMVVSPSWVTTEDPSIFSRQSSEFCCSWIHLQSFSPFGQGWLRIPSSNCIFVLETVILGGCLVIKGSGFGAQVVCSLDFVLRFGTSMWVSVSWVSHSLSSSRTLVAVIEGARCCNNNSCYHWRI